MATDSHRRRCRSAGLQPLTVRAQRVPASAAPLVLRLDVVPLGATRVVVMHLPIVRRDRVERRYLRHRTILWFWPFVMTGSAADVGYRCSRGRPAPPRSGGPSDPPGSAPCALATSSPGAPRRHLTSWSSRTAPGPATPQGEKPSCMASSRGVTSLRLAGPVGLARLAAWSWSTCAPLHDARWERGPGSDVVSAARPGEPQRAERRPHLNPAG